ncbi:MAG: dethiobiotin synthase [Hyphomicrobiales bacterium]|nr:dethiobiotin synthase [Hyphomicrobiales bacterium]
MSAFVVSGTDTGVGKTVFSAALAGALNATYWKPVQAGLDEETDRETVARLSGLPQEMLLPEAYRLNAPLSPHRAAELDHVEITREALQLPAQRPLVVEGAGGLMVPLRRDLLFIDVYVEWGLPVILCARTGLGTINHTLLSLEALRSRKVPVLGVAFIGTHNADNEATIVALGSVRRLGRLPILADLDAASLAQAFRDHFEMQLFAGAR